MSTIMEKLQSSWTKLVSGIKGSQGITDKKIEDLIAECLSEKFKDVSGITRVDFFEAVKDVVEKTGKEINLPNRETLEKLFDENHIKDGSGQPIMEKKKFEKAIREHFGEVIETFDIDIEQFYNKFKPVSGITRDDFFEAVTDTIKKINQTAKKFDVPDQEKLKELFVSNRDIEAGSGQEVMKEEKFVNIISGQDFGKNIKRRAIAKTYEKKLEMREKLNFIAAIIHTVENINEKLEVTQFRLPSEEDLEKFFIDRYYSKTDLRNKPMERDTFVNILRDGLLKGGVTNFGIKDIIFYICGIPAVTWWIKKQVTSKGSDDIFIPGVTMATVVFLSKSGKI